MSKPSCYERVFVPNFVHVYQLLQDRGLPKASTSVCASYLHAVDFEGALKTFHTLLELFVPEVMQCFGPLGACAAVFGQLPRSVVILGILQYVS